MANKGLGRGLGSLLGILDEEVEIKDKPEVKNEEVETKKTLNGETVEYLEIGKIDNNPNQPR